ncbi:MAG: type II toxin-antitoxin system RelE/ParE family toxin [Deltaproteobacteria bacterium]|nr:type II toxin-antitoxin system RelE/ParE family toxin [Deltaproteobacteria bacterium]
MAIKTFRQSWLEEFWHTGKHKRAPAELEARLLRKMDMLNRAAALKDLQAPPSNRLHALRGDREGQWAISVSGSWRLCFRFQAGDIFDLELVQYH